MTDSQLNSIKEDDARAQKEFLTSEPKNLDVGLKSNETVAKILNNWG